MSIFQILGTFDGIWGFSTDTLLTKLGSGTLAGAETNFYVAYAHVRVCVRVRHNIVKHVSYVSS